jgi:PDZ domain
MARRYVLVCALLLTSCAGNPFAQFYHPNNELVLRTVPQRRLHPPPETPELLRGNNPQEDIPALQADGWVVIGESSFNGPKLDEDDAVDQGRKVGADRIVMYGRLASTEHTTIPLTLPTTQTSVTNGMATAYGSAGVATAYGSSTTTTYGTQTTYLPMTIHRYDALAVYLVKVRYAFGGLFRDLSPSESQRVGTVNGTTVAVVVRGSPAAAAGILPGDVILKADGEPVIDGAHLSEFLQARQGRAVEFQILRADKRSDVSVTLGSY